MVESQHPIDSQEAARLLAGAHAAQAGVATAATATRAEILHYALGTATLIAAAALAGWYSRGEQALVGAALLLTAGAGFGLLGSYVSRSFARTGVWVSSMRPRRARWIAWLVVPVLLVLGGAAFAAAAAALWVVAVIVVAVTVPVMVGMSRWWQHEFEAGLGMRHE